MKSLVPRMGKHTPLPLLRNPQCSCFPATGIDSGGHVCDNFRNRLIAGLNNDS